MKEHGSGMSVKIVSEGGTGEIAEKKSRFIATVRPVETEAEAAAFIEEMKKKYWDATHNCSAYVIGDRGEITGCRDDGEPSGTAGRPMLEVLLGEEICNAAIVVTRYFGGTLLGTGGLARAYTKAAKEGLSKSVIAKKRRGIRIKLTADYTNIGKIQRILQGLGITECETVYTEIVEFVVILPVELQERLTKELTEATNGKSAWESLGELYFIDKKQSV